MPNTRFQFVRNRPTIAELEIFLSGEYLPGSPLASNSIEVCEKFISQMKSHFGSIEYAWTTPPSEFAQVYMRPTNSQLATCLVFNLSCGTPYACWADASCTTTRLSCLTAFNTNRLYDYTNKLEDMAIGTVEILTGMGFVFPDHRALLSPLDESLRPLFFSLTNNSPTQGEPTVFDALFWYDK